VTGFRTRVGVCREFEAARRSVCQSSLGKRGRDPPDVENQMTRVGGEEHEQTGKESRRLRRVFLGKRKGTAAEEERNRVYRSTTRQASEQMSAVHDDMTRGNQGDIA